MSFFFFFNDTATTEIYTLSLHDALPIFHLDAAGRLVAAAGIGPGNSIARDVKLAEMLISRRSEEHTSELQSRRDLVCRLLLEKKKKHPRARLTPTRVRCSYPFLEAVSPC